VTYRLTRSRVGWPNQDYTLSAIQTRCKKLGLTIRDGYGRTRIRSARKLVLSNGVTFRVTEEEKPSRAFGPRTEPEVD
jgi:hypothetical protein